MKRRNWIQVRFMSDLLRTAAQIRKNKKHTKGRIGERMLYAVEGTKTKRKQEGEIRKRGTERSTMTERCTRKGSREQRMRGCMRYYERQRCIM